MEHPPRPSDSPAGTPDVLRPGAAEFNTRVILGSSA